MYRREHMLTLNGVQAEYTTLSGPAGPAGPAGPVSPLLQLIIPIINDYGCDQEASEIFHLKLFNI